MSIKVTEFDGVCKRYVFGDMVLAAWSWLQQMVDKLSSMCFIHIDLRYGMNL